MAVAPSLDHPIPHVIVTHIGGLSNPCDSVYNCSIKMRTIQDKAIAEHNKVDIKANFYVNDISEEICYIMVTQSYSLGVQRWLHICWSWLEHPE